jgi:hypothetical protein
MIGRVSMALFFLQLFITIKYILWQKTTRTRVASKATRVHKAVNMVTRDAPDKVLKVELNPPAPREARVLKADAAIRAWADHAVEAQAAAAIKTAVVATANDYAIVSIKPGIAGLIFTTTIPIVKLYSGFLSC